ncbi:MAG: hypothetical protein LBI10_09680 [Deltaproteobacteria bacterium]|jgi:hypothetical protein|nr:hypothetical protein [Deltaproteobacteria bacterium]
MIERLFKPTKGQTALKVDSDPLIAPQRYLFEEEFQANNFYPNYLGNLIEPLAAVDYPKLKAGDLAVTRHKGSFLRPCPATLLYNCCGLNIFHIGQGCPLGCHYCVLAAYLGSSATIRFGNFKDGLKELTQILQAIERADPNSPALGVDRSYRFCTGEFTDSLIYDQGFGVSASLVQLFKDYPKSSL